MSIKDVTTTGKGGWQPQPDETLAGTIIDISVAENGYGPYPVISVDVDDGVVSVHAFHTTLREQLKMRGAQIGERVSITFMGRAGDGVGTDAYLYAVRVGDEPQAFNWDTLEYTHGVKAKHAAAAARSGDAPADDGPAKSDIPADDDIPF